MANFASFPSKVRLKFPANYAIGAQAFRVDTPTTTVTDCHFYGIALPACPRDVNMAGGGGYICPYIVQNAI